MSRVLLLALAGVFALASAPADAAARKTSKSSVAKSKKKKKAAAKKKRLAKAKKKKKSTRVAKRLKTTRTPLVKVATVQSDGRVRYGADRMPPGFAWPPTKEMRAASKSCEQALDGLGITWEPASPEGMLVDPIVVPSMEIGGIKYVSAYKRGPHKLDCQFVHALAVIGPELHAIGVREVQFGSIYRNTMARSHGQTKQFLSRHALGIAMDIKSFVDADGRVASVEMDYLKGDSLLHGIEDTINKSARFRWVLTPGNDPISHDDHFHIEASVDFTAFR